MLNSIWTDSVTLPAFPALENDLQTDVLIIGGGLAGILCAYQLHQENINYALIEADTICNGVTRNTTAKITSQHGLVYGKLVRQFDPFTARRYWEANELAIRRYRELAQTIDCDFEVQDHFIYTTDSSDILVKELSALRKAGIPSRFEKRLGLPFPTAGAVCFPDQAQFHPLKFAAEVAKGLTIYEHTPAKTFEGNVVFTGKYRITAKKIIIATHFPILNKHGGYFLRMYQQRSYVLALENAPLVSGMYLDPAKDGVSLRNHGSLLLLGGGGHRTGKQGGGWEFLEQFARKHFPKSREVCRWATQDCISLDGIPYIGQYSRATPDLFVATGFNKWGMSSSMVSALILSDLVQGKRNSYAEIFSPQRTCLRPQLLANGASTAVHLLKPTAPRCPHMGCALEWNPQEHSWDCPCHGSRFHEDGTLLDNPSTGNLKSPKC